MASESSQSSRRIGILVNYVAIVMIAVLFYVGKYHGWSALVFVGIGIAIVLALAGFISVHVKSHLWKLVHAKAETLDERERLITLESLRYSYAIFSVTCIAIVLCLALLAGRHDSMLMLICVILAYLAHTLPSSILAWTQRRAPAE